MSPLLRRPGEHDRARELAALRVDEPLEPGDASWLEDHLAGCPQCAAVAEAYEADSQLFAPLREAAPLPPRDLWARTAAAIDAESGAVRPGRPAGRRLLGLPIAALAPIAAVGVVAVVVGSTLLTGAPGPAGPVGPGATAVATTGGQVAIITRGEDGRLEVRSVDVDEVCPPLSDQCETAVPSFDSELLARIPRTENVDAIISPRRDRIVVVQRDASGADGVYVVPVRPAGTAGSPAATEPPPTDETPDPSPEPAATASADPTPASTATADASPSELPPASPGTEPAESPTGSAVAPATPEPSDGSASPAATPERSPDPTPAPTVKVTPAPDGTIEIARDVVVVGTVAAYDDRGDRFAFTARPADGSLGPDVYVWHTDDAEARAVTSDHASVFAGWDDGELLVSRVVDGIPRTIAVNARTGAEKAERGDAAWLPTISPDGSRAVWWDGTVRLAADGVTWVADRGRLVVGAWPDGAADAQVLARGNVTSWEVQWSPDGRTVGVWTSPGRSSAVGRISLYRVDRSSRQVDLDRPLVDDEAAFAGFSLVEGQLAYAAPAGGRDRTVWVVALRGDTVVGTLRLSGEEGATLVR